MNNSISVREIIESDIELIINYWQNANEEFLVGMGVDLNKLPSSEEWKVMLQHVVKDPFELKKSFCTIWLENDIPIGHCNVNKIVFGQEAYMHLHLWNSSSRKKGLGVELVKKSIRLFFQKLQLKELFCEPYSLNPAPNKTLEKIGFTFLKTYITIPGSLNFEQRVNLWQLKKEKLTDL